MRWVPHPLDSPPRPSSTRALATPRELQHRSPVLLRTPALTATTLICLAALTACSTDDTRTDTATSATADTALGHVHGLGVDPADGTLYVASHNGVFRVEDGGPERVADRWQDTMGFAVVGPGHFLGSGHPDLQEKDLPSSLGLIESTDGAETWQAVSMQGDADLHAIEPVGDRIYAYDSHTGALIVTNNRTDWDTIATQPLYDIAANPANPTTVYATTDQGVLVASMNGSEPAPVPGAPTLAAIDWQPDGPLVGIAPDGTVNTSTDARTWTEAGALDGVPEALDASPGVWHAATESGVYESTDDGATWSLVIPNGNG